MGRRDSGRAEEHLGSKIFSVCSEWEEAEEVLHRDQGKLDLFRKYWMYP
jgi:hypothetical protein